MRVLQSIPPIHHREREDSAEPELAAQAPCATERDNLRRLRAYKQRRIEARRCGEVQS